MKKSLLILFLSVFLLSYQNSSAQCSVCSRTTQQMGEKPAKGMNTGIIYLMLAPFAIAGYIGYRWWRDNRD